MKHLVTLLAASMCAAYIALMLLLAAPVQAQLIPVTQTQADLQSLSRDVDAALYYSTLWANSLNKIGDVWALPDDRLENVLEALGQERVTALLQLQAAQAQVLNVGFEAAGSATRVSATPSREFTWENPTNVVITPLPTPTPEPTPEP